MTWVWESGLPPMERLVALAYADHADHEGNNIYPSLGTVATKTGMDRANVARIRRRLVEKGVMVPTQFADRKPTRFRMDHAALIASVTQPLDEDAEASVTGTAPSVTRPLGLVSQGQLTSVTGTPNPSLTVNKTINEPSLAADADAPQPAKPIRKRGTIQEPKERQPDPHFDAIAMLCELNPQLQGSRIAKASHALKRAGATVEQIAGFKAWWLSDDWRRGHRPVPTPEQVLAGWEQARRYKPGANGNGHAQASTLKPTSDPHIYTAKNGVQVWRD